MGKVSPSAGVPPREAGEGRRGSYYTAAYVYLTGDC